jgi:hypothetical protein
MPGRNDRCHCGSGKKYKKCCMHKDERRAELKKRLANISRKDFIGEPYKRCPQCAQNTFGVLLLGSRGNGYGRECYRCGYSAGFQLPEINKKLIYLDQFFISNITKALDPDSKSHERAMKQPFWIEAYKRLDTLGQLNLALYPDSFFHTDESLLSGDPSYESLRHVYEHLSRGCTFYDHNTITRFQIHQQFDNYLAGSPEKPLELVPERVIHGDPHRWNERIRVSVNMKPYVGQLEAIRKERAGSYEGMKSVFTRWQSEKGRDFMDWVREEAYAFGRATLLAHKAYLEKQMALPQKWADEYLAGKELDISLEDVFPPASSELVSDLMRAVHARGYTGEGAFRKMAEYLFSKHLIDIPTIHISSLLYAGLARKAASGQKEVPNIGTFTDVNAIASLLPYCDAIFLDNGMAALLRDQPIAGQVERYGTKIFSLNTKEEFLAYLDSIRANADPAHIEAALDSYGEPGPYVSLLTNKREQDELDEVLDD